MIKMVKIDNGIILDGKVYEAVAKGSYHCSDCDLYEQCCTVYHSDIFPTGKGVLQAVDYCGVIGQRVIFRYSQPLTDKINEQ